MAPKLKMQVKIQNESIYVYYFEKQSSDVILLGNDYGKGET